MSTNRRFVLNKDRYIIDTLSPANAPRGYCHEGDPEDDKYLRERVLMCRLRDPIDKLIVNPRPMRKYPTGEEYQPINEETLEIWTVILSVIRASHLNTFDPGMSNEHAFSSELHRQKKAIRIRLRCRFSATTLNLSCATSTATSIARRWTGSCALCSLS
jgi:hypothetical protein